MQDVIAYKMLSNKINTIKKEEETKLKQGRMILPRYLFFKKINENTIVDMIGEEVFIKKGCFYYSENGLVVSENFLEPIDNKEMEIQENAAMSEYFIYTIHVDGINEFYSKMRGNNKVLKKKIK